MSYFNELGLKEEPFSTSPDPNFFYQSREHGSALRRLEIAVRLKRGMSLILGDVGVGKTTLSRILMQSFHNENNFIFHMILNPNYKSEFQFLSSLAKRFGVDGDLRSSMDCQDAIERYLFQKGVEEEKTVVLLIDEGQKLSLSFLEVLRTLLNYETNKCKLLQLIIMAQLELLPKIKHVRNFTDRISLKYIINPLGKEDTKKLILFRLEQAGLDNFRDVFTDDAIDEIYKYSLGYPRRIALLCHDTLENLIIEGKKIVDKEFVLKTIERNE